MSSDRPIRIVRAHRVGIPALLDIARGLPEWFTPGGVAQMALDFAFQHRRVAVVAGEPAGFITYFVHEGVGRIGWLGVRSDMHRLGLGRALVASVEAELGAAGVPDVDVDTLGDAVDYEPYARTRAFYRALGYQDHRRITQDNPECPEQLTLRKALPVLMHQYVALHNRGVRSGDFRDMAKLFAPAGRLSFEGRPFGPFEGPEAIEAAFAAHPPSDELILVRSERPSPEQALGRWAWAAEPGTPGGEFELAAGAGAIAALMIIARPDLR